MKKRFFNKALRLLLFTNFIILIATAMLGPIYALFVEEIGGSLLDASLTAGIFSIVAGIVNLFSGKISDKNKHPKNIIGLGYLITSIGFYSYFFVNSLATLFIVQVILGIGSAIYWPAFDALYSKHLAKTRRGRGWGAWEAMANFTIGIGAILGGFLITLLGFKSVFLIMGTITLASALYMLIKRNGEL